MKYFFIYSAGGGAGDWNGVKRVWNNSMPVQLKSNILLKFGDIFFNHRGGNNNLIRPQRWNNVCNLRNWLYEDVNDPFVLNTSNIFLDSGSAKIVSYITSQNANANPRDIYNEFDRLVDINQILDKYIDIIIESQINSAVTFDVPEPFKNRNNSGNNNLSVLSNGCNLLSIEYTAKYANLLYEKLVEKTNIHFADEVLYTIINGQWSQAEFNTFLSLLNYVPKKIAIGGITRSFRNNLINLSSYNLSSFDSVHYLGCGGTKNVKLLKDYNLNFFNSSVDVSTPINRSIDGNLSGTSQSGYFTYDSQRLIRIKPDTINEIKTIHSTSNNKCFSDYELNDILNKILNHQSFNSSQLTYDARAKLIIHNSDVFRKYAL